MKFPVNILCVFLWVIFRLSVDLLLVFNEYCVGVLWIFCMFSVNILFVFCGYIMFSATGLWVLCVYYVDCL